MIDHKHFPDTISSSIFVKGGTKIYGVIGDPISHSFSPRIHNTIAAALGHDLIYVPFHVTQDGLEAAIKGAEVLGIQGLNVTIPHKKAVMPYLSGLDASAREAGSVNTLLLGPNGYTGYNTDCIGMYKSIVSMGVTVANKSVMVLGAGGSAYAACIMAASRGASEIYIVNRTLEHAKTLAVHVNTYYSIPVRILSYGDILDIKKDLVIQTTSLGFGPHTGVSPVSDQSFFKNVEMVLDIIYSPWETVFLRDARASGVNSANGFDMLIYQAVAAYEIWRGLDLEEEFVERAARILREEIQR